MKHILIILLFLFPVIASAQFPANPRKQVLGYQTTADGLLYRGSGAPSFTPSSSNDARAYIDTETGDLYVYNSGWIKIGRKSESAAYLDTLAQINHGFSVGDPIWYSGDYLLALDTSTVVQVDGIVIDSVDANSFVIQKTGRFTLSSHGFTVDVQLYVQPDGSYSISDTTNSLVYGYAVDANTIQIGLKSNDAFKLIEPRTFEFSRTSFNSVTRAKNNSKIWVVSDTVLVSGNLDLSDLDIIFEKKGFISGADTITANGATITANPNKKIFSSSTVIDPNSTWGNEFSYIEWTTGSDLTDSLVNWVALTNAVQIGKVRLGSNTYRFGPASSESFYTDKDVYLIGNGSDNTHFIMSTDKTRQHMYFGGPEGSPNFHAEGIKFSTLQYVDGDTTVTNGENNQYSLLGSEYNSFYAPNAKPSADFIRFLRCEINGDIRVRFNSSNDNQTVSEYIDNIIKKVEVESCVFNFTKSFLTLSNIIYDHIVFRSNKIDELYGVFLNAPLQLGGDSIDLVFEDTCYALRRLIEFENNEIRNDNVYSVTDIYMSGIVAKGKHYRIINNVFEGIRNSYALNSSQETYSFYVSSPDGSRMIRGNRVTDCMGADGVDNSLLKFKGYTGQSEITDNTFVVTKEGLLSIGVIDSLTQDLTTLTESDYYLDLIGALSNNVDKSGDWVIKNNVFKTPFLSAQTQMRPLSLDFSNNYIEVDYFAKQNGRIFNINPNNVTGGQWISNGNTWRIGKSYSSSVYIYYSDFNGNNTTNLAQTAVNYSDILMGDSIEFLYALPFCEIANVDLKVIGKGSSAAAYSAKDLSLRNGFWVRDFYNSKIEASDFKQQSDKGVFFPDAYSKGEITGFNNSSERLLFYNNTVNEGLYGMIDTVSMLFKIELTWEDSFGNNYRDEYRMIAGYPSGTNRGWRFIDEDTDSFTTKDPYNNTGADTVYIMQYRGESSPIDLVWENDSSDRSHLLSFFNFSTAKDFNLKWSMKPLDSGLTSAQKDSLVQVRGSEQIVGNLLRGYGLGTKTGSNTNTTESNYIALFGDNGRILEKNISAVTNLYTGWAEYSDSTYTSDVSAFSITAGNKVTLPNDGAGIRDSQIPIDIDSLFSIADTTILGRNGDGLNVLVEFTAEPQTAGATYLDTSIDIGGSVGEIYQRTHTFPKGTGVSRSISFSIGTYTLDTWESNGGKVKVVSDGPVDIWNIRYVLTRTHKAR